MLRDNTERKASGNGRGTLILGKRCRDRLRAKRGAGGAPGRLAATYPNPRLSMAGRSATTYRAGRFTAVPSKCFPPNHKAWHKLQSLIALKPVALQHTKAPTNDSNDILLRLQAPGISVRNPRAR